MMAARLFNYFPPPDVGDPKTLLSGAVKMFLSFPRKVVDAVCDPVSGLPAKSKWAPNLAELRMAIDIEMAPILRQIERDKIAAEHRMALPAPMAKRKTYEELQAELAEVGIYIGSRGATAKPVNIKDFRDKYGITDEQWNAIPNARRA